MYSIWLNDIKFLFINYRLLYDKTKEIILTQHQNQNQHVDDDG